MVRMEVYTGIFPGRDYYRFKSRYVACFFRACKGEYGGGVDDEGSKYCR